MFSDFIRGGDFASGLVAFDQYPNKSYGRAECLTCGCSVESAWFLRGCRIKSCPCGCQHPHKKRIEVSRLPFPQDPVLRHFFEQMPGFKQEQESTSLGSGVIVSAQGHVVTNFHVVEGADEIVVALRDGRQSRAKTIGIDPESDLSPTAHREAETAKAHRG